MVGTLEHVSVLTSQVAYRGSAAVRTYYKLASTSRQKTLNTPSKEKPKILYKMNKYLRAPYSNGDLSGVPNREDVDPTKCKEIFLTSQQLRQKITKLKQLNKAIHSR